MKSASRARAGSRRTMPAIRASGIESRSRGWIIAQGWKCRHASGRSAPDGSLFETVELDGRHLNANARPAELGRRCSQVGFWETTSVARMCAAAPAAQHAPPRDQRFTPGSTALAAVNVGRPTRRKTVRCGHRGWAQRARARAFRAQALSQLVLQSSTLCGGGEVRPRRILAAGHSQRHKL